MKVSRSPLNIGVIGAGWWATTSHIPGILEHKNAKLLAVHSRSKQKAFKVAYDFGAENAFDDYRALIKNNDIDAVVVSSTPNMHYEQVKFALIHDKHVLVEKPMTFTSREALELCDLAQKKDLQLSVSCPWHFTRHAFEAKRLIGDGKIGEVKMISVLMTNPIDKLLKGINTAPTHGFNTDVYMEPNKGSYNDPAIAGGGQIYSQVSHTGAYLCFLLEAQPLEVYAKFDFDGSVNDIYDMLMVTMEGDAIVTIASTGATPLNLRNYEIRIYGTKGVLLLELWKGEMEYYDFEGNQKKYEPLDPDEIYPEKRPVSNFINACLGTEKNGSTGILGLGAMRIIEAAKQSSERNKSVKIEEL